MKPQKHAELIKAWADGAEIEYKGCLASDWTCLENFDWSGLGDYRIKPEPKLDVVEYRYVERQYLVPVQEEVANLKLTFDGETGKLIEAELL